MNNKRSRSRSLESVNSIALDNQYSDEEENDIQVKYNEVIEPQQIKKKEGFFNKISNLFSSKDNKKNLENKS